MNAPRGYGMRILSKLRYCNCLHREICLLFV